jgi:hypothetical protein
MNDVKSQRILQANKGEFALFIDESGSPKPNPKDETKYFALGGVLLEREDEPVVESAISAFKTRWNIDPHKPLHGNEIRSKKKNFAWLGKCSEQEQNRFILDLTQTLTSLPIVVHACVVSRTGYLNRYFDQYGSETWEMMKSAFNILIERSAKYAGKQDGSIMIYYEEAGKNEDRLIKQYFNELRSLGHPFNPSNAAQYSPLASDTLSQCLRGIEGKKKNNPILQVADLCLYPVARGMDNPNDRAYLALKENNLLVDTKLESEEIKSLGIKYYCFDHLI